MFGEAGNQPLAVAHHPCTVSQGTPAPSRGDLFSFLITALLDAPSIYGWCLTCHQVVLIGSRGKNPEGEEGPIKSGHAPGTVASIQNIPIPQASPMRASTNRTSRATRRSRDAVPAAWVRPSLTGSSRALAMICDTATMICDTANLRSRSSNGRWRHCARHMPGDAPRYRPRSRRGWRSRRLKFRCTNCSSTLTDFVVMSRDALGVQPWKADGAEPTGAVGAFAGTAAD